MRLLRHCCAILVVALVAAGCGLAADPVVSSEGEVLEALLALRDGAEGRLTAVLDVDEDEVRDVLRGDPAARALLEREFDGDGEVDDLVAALDDARARLDEQALLLATGADGSARIAVESRGDVWLDLRAGGVLREPDTPAAGGQIDLQVRVDWATAAVLLDEPDLLGDLEEVAAELNPLLGSLPQTAAVQRVLLGFLGGELIAVSGSVGPELLDGLDALSGTADDRTTLPDLDIDPAQALATALSFDDFRRVGEDTLVDVSIELRAAAELVLDEVAAAPDAVGMTDAQIRDARAEVAALPVRLTDVAVLRLGPDGTVQQVRTDVVDVGLQLARAVDAGDPDLAIVERLAAQLDATGLFTVLDVTAVGTTPTVLASPTASATPEEVVAAFRALLFTGLAGGLDTGAVLDGLEGLGRLGDTDRRAGD